MKRMAKAAIRAPDEDVIVPLFGRIYGFYEAMAFTGLTEKRLRRLVLKKKIAVYRDGRLGFFENDLREWLAQHRTPAIGEAPKGSPRVDPAELKDLMPPTRRLMVSSARTRHAGRRKHDKDGTS